MSAQRLGQSKFDVRITPRQPIARRREIALDVNAGRQEVRHQHHQSSPLLDTATTAAIDVRLGQLQKRFNNTKTLFAQAGCDMSEIIVRFRLPAAVRDK
jgi:hypothetical protein